MSLVRNIHKSYQSFPGTPFSKSQLEFCLHIPEWEILDQGVTILWGPSGSGKTTLLRILIGLDSCPSMTWFMGSTPLHLLSPPQKRLGVVFQGDDLFPHLTVQENILFAARARHLPKEEAFSKLEEYVRTLGLSKCVHLKSGYLSGGEKQRVALARALIGRPRLLILDEPFSALDEGNRSEARELVRRVITEAHIPLLLVTHDVQDVKILGDRVTCLKEGHIEVN